MMIHATISIIQPRDRLDVAVRGSHRALSYVTFNELAAALGLSPRSPYGRTVKLREVCSSGLGLRIRRGIIDRAESAVSPRVRRS